ncbi:MAG TPA: hypothetical protein VHW47_00770, partial [Acidimicrobiales bacterium]|nr:hypothetical protein [Acidimicrobiales bacterium]
MSPALPTVEGGSGPGGGAVASVTDLPGLGATRVVATNSRLALDDPSLSWVVTGGEIRVFAVEMVDGRPDGPMHPLTTAGVGALIYPSAPEGASFGLCVVGVVPGSTARPIARAELRRLARTEPVVVRALERFVARMVGPLVGVEAGEVMAGSDGTSLAVGEEVALSPGDRSFPRHPGVWLPMSDGLALQGRPAAGTVPVPAGVWVECREAATVTPVTGGEALATDAGWEGLDAFVAAGLDLLGELVEQRNEDEVARLRRLADYESELRVGAYTELGMVLEAGDGPSLRRRLGPTDDLLAACRTVAGAAGIELVEPPAASLESTDEPLALIARHSRMRIRDVVLSGRWWRNPGSPLLARLAADGRWVALLPQGA